jgi:hypothetical protein
LIAVEERRPRAVGRGGAVYEVSSERFEVLSADSSLTFFAMSSVQSVYGKTAELSGFIEAAWNADGTLVLNPSPRMHVEFQVESLRTGNELQDRGMWNLIESKRFPKVAADLRDAKPGAARGRYTASGQVTLAGLARGYEGEFALERDGNRVIVDGDINVDVRDFGLKPMNLLVLNVAPLVKVRLHLVTAQGG